ISVPRAGAANRFPNGSTRFCNGMMDLLAVARLAPVENAQDDDAIVLDTILKNIGRIQDAQHDLTVMFISGNRMPKSRIFAQHARLLDEIVADHLGHCRETVVKEARKSIEVRDRVTRPLDPHRSDHGRNWGVPHVWSQCSTSACGTVPNPPATAAQRRSSSASAASLTASGTSLAIRSETLTPRSAARVFNSAAVALSSSMDSVRLPILKS